MSDTPAEDTTTMLPGGLTSALAHPIVNLTPAMVPLVMPVQDACYPEHLIEEADSFTAKVAASPTTSFVCLHGGAGAMAFPTGDDAISTVSASAAPLQRDSTHDKSCDSLAGLETGAVAACGKDAEADGAAGSPPRALGYLVTIPAERFEAPPLDSAEFTVRAPEEADTLYLHDMAVLPEARGTGVAQTLLALADQKRAELQLPRMALIAVEGADRYWARHGFERVGEEHLPDAMVEKLKGYGEGATYMEKVSATTGAVGR